MCCLVYSPLGPDNVSRHLLTRPGRYLARAAYLHVAAAVPWYLYGSDGQTLTRRPFEWSASIQVIDTNRMKERSSESPGTPARTSRVRKHRPKAGFEPKTFRSRLRTRSSTQEAAVS